MRTERADRETSPASEHETEAVAIFERLIREFGERAARVAHITVLTGELDQ